MRSLSSSVQAALAKKHGLELSVFLGVEWYPGNEEYFSSFEIEGARHSIVSITGVQTTQQIAGNGQSESMTVVLSDTDGFLTNILDQVDPHKRPAKLYLGFGQAPIEQAVLILDGEINSDMEWDARARTFTFTVLSKIEGDLFGFAAEDGLFEKVDDQTRYIPWPFRFGDTCTYPAIEIRNGETGLLQQGEGVVDPTLDAKICTLQNFQCPLIEAPFGSPGQDQDYTDADAYTDWIGGDPGDTDRVFGIVRSRLEPLGYESDLQQYYTPDGVPLVEDVNCKANKFKELCQLYRDKANQLQYSTGVLSVFGGEEFPQNVDITIRVQDVVFEGQMNGTDFTIADFERLDKPSDINCANVSPLEVAYSEVSTGNPRNLTECETPEQLPTELTALGGAIEGWQKYGEIPDSGFKWLPAGSKVTLESGSTKVHIVSMVTGTVTGVYAFRSFGETKILTEVPTDYYEVVTSDYGDADIVELWLPKALSAYPDEKWEDQLYVSFDSDVGPNPVDVIEWIINNWTSLDVDAATFADVKTKVQNYPANLYYAGKQNALEVIQQIAYEARCALTVTNDLVKIIYLPTKPDAAKEFTDADVIAGSKSVFLTRTEDLITSSEVTWQQCGVSFVGDDEAATKFSVENNVFRYGYVNEESTYQTINNQDQAEKTATFWSIRDSNTWKNISLSTSLEHLDLELFDAVDLNIADFPQVRAVVTGMAVDPDQGLIEFTLWTPVLSGTDSEYKWAWPADVGQFDKYPDFDVDLEEPEKQIGPPPGHPLYVQPPSGEIKAPPSIGGQLPSDAGDVFPVTPDFSGSDPQMVDAIEPSFDRIKFDATSAAANASNTANQNQDENWTFKDEPETRSACDQTVTEEECIFTVTHVYNTCITANDPAIPGPCKPEQVGGLCTGEGYEYLCRAFSNFDLAYAFFEAVNEQADGMQGTWTEGVRGPIFASPPVQVSGSPGCGNEGVQLGVDYEL